MAFQRQANVISAHSGAIVRDLNEIESPFLKANIDLAGPGVDRVFDQLLQGAGRTLDNLSGSDPIYQAIWNLPPVIFS